jgi:SAM-dependent methyltransferase
MLLRRSFLGTFAVSLFRGQNRQPNMFGDAEAYERFMGRWSRLVAARLLDFVGLPQRGRVLDVGSGTGSLAFAITEGIRGVSVLGIDPSKEYVAYANSKNSFPDRAAFEVGDAQQLHHPDASFDAAVSLLVFNFIPDPKKALAEVRRVTRPGGILSAAVWDYGDGMRMLRTFWASVVSIDPGAEKLDEKHMRLCRSGELSALWRDGGLQNVHEQAIEIRMKFASFDDYWDPFLLGQGPAGAYLRRLDRNQLQRVREDVERRLAVSTESSSFELPARVWAVRGAVPNRR